VSCTAVSGDSTAVAIRSLSRYIRLEEYVARSIAQRGGDLRYPLAAAIIACCALLVACSKPDEAIIPGEASKYEQIKPKIDKLPQEEREVLMRYLVRMRIGAAAGTLGEIPAGTTLRLAIETQRAFEAEQEAKELAAKALKEKLERENAEHRKALEEAVQVVLISLRHIPKNVDANRYSDVMSLRLGFENKSGKDVAGVQGVAIFRDMFGNEVQRVRLAYSRGLAAGVAITWDGTVELNQFSDRDRAFAELESSSAKFQFEPDMIVFKDGTSIKARR
jgi:hypothetical protein